MMNQNDLPTTLSSIPPCGEARPSLPPEFEQYTRRLMGDELYARFLSALGEAAPVSIRLNTAKWTGRPDGYGCVPWCADGYYLAGRPAFTFDPLLHAGCYYVQEASSMFVSHVLRQFVSRPVSMLDLCAAPGGKSTAALSALPAGSTLMSNEPVRQRAQVLAENMQKWGQPEVIVTNSYPADYARSGLMFDVILCDVPCSGEGMFRKDAGAVDEWSPQNVDSCSRLQREIAAAAWQCLRPGGLMIYSTCTFNARENEENVAWIIDNLGGEVLPVAIGSDWGIHGSLLPGFTAPVCRFIPGQTRGEGLFCAVIRKEDAEKEPLLTSPKGRRKAGSRQAAGRGDADILSSWLLNPDDFCIRRNGEAVIALPNRIAALYDAALPSLRILSAGVTLGRGKGNGRDFIPDQSLALSTALRHDAFPRVELPYDKAVAYLRKEAFALPDGTPRGFVLVTWRGVPLGFMKNIGQRANNLYPQEWKIKSSHVPDSQPRGVL